MSNFTVVSLFSGAGGLDIGLERVGFTVVGANDVEEVCCQTLRENQKQQLPIKHKNRTFLEHTKIVPGDITKLSGQDLSQGRSIDLVVGGPPCQTFSSSGKMQSVLDPRGQLFLEFVRIVDELQPKCFLFENVRGLVTAKDKNGIPGGVIKTIIESFEAIGYSCRVDLLNAADYGAFQRRVRCFIMGVKHGTAPLFPPATFSRKAGDAVQLDLLHQPLKPWKSLGEFLEQYADSNSDNWIRPTPELAQKLKDIPEGSGLKSSGVVESTRPGGHWGYRQGTFIADTQLPARTVTGSSSQDWIRLKDGSLRRLTLQEVAQLQGFPPQWRFCGTKAQQYKQVGNAVPTIFGEVLGQEFIRYLKTVDESLPPQKIPMPKKFYDYIEYTRKENDRNRDSRQRKQKAKTG
ncbi:DNA cytosine methyltransferase [Baaleninema sp.]|uniref:DNA cytosine methyltransferase n=1 Tax=Baaleninema sp. TaxID=3101197 RepID=UPI003CFFDF03